MEQAPKHSSSGRHRKPETGDVSSAAPEPAEEPGITYDETLGPWEMPEAWSEEDNSEVLNDSEEHGLENQEPDAPERQEAGIRLKGSQYLDQRALEGLDFVLKSGTEKASEWTENKKFNIKSYYIQHEIDSGTKKLARYRQKSETAVAGVGLTTFGVGRFRRRKFARKARLMQRRLHTLNGFKQQLQIGFDGRKTRENDNGISLIREARQKQLQGRLREMLKVEKGYYEKVGMEQPMIQNKNGEWIKASYFDMVREGRRNKRVMKASVKHPDTPRASIATLNRLIRSTRSVESLEALGREGFVKEIAHLPIIRDTVSNAAARVVNEFHETLRNEAKDK